MKVFVPTTLPLPPKAEEFIDWLNFQWNLELSNGQRLIIKSKLEQYGDEREAEGIERGKIIGEHGCESYIE